MISSFSWCVSSSVFSCLFFRFVISNLCSTLDLFFVRQSWKADMGSRDFMRVDTAKNKTLIWCSQATASDCEKSLVWTGAPRKTPHAKRMLPLKSVRPNAEWGWCGKLCPSFPVRWRLSNGNNVERLYEILNLARCIIENNRLWHLTFKDEMDGWSTRCSPKTWRKKCWLRKKCGVEKLTSPSASCPTRKKPRPMWHTGRTSGWHTSSLKKTKNGERWKRFRSSNAKRLLETGKGL